MRTHAGNPGLPWHRKEEHETQHKAQSVDSRPRESPEAALTQREALWSSGLPAPCDPEGAATPSLPVLLSPLKTSCWTAHLSGSTCVQAKKISPHSFSRSHARPGSPILQMRKLSLLTPGA